MQNSNTSIQLHPAVLLPIILSLFYWSYLGLTSQTLIYHDSIGYQNAGTILFHGPWKEYFTTGPNREPIYPLLISWAMRIAQGLNCDYLKIQIILQIGLMLATQWMTAVLLKKLRVSVGISALAVAYLGISPSFVNSGFILYSEIITYPLIVWLVLRLAHTWTQLKTASLSRTAINGTLLAVAALAITFTKGIFEVIAPLLLIPFILTVMSKRSDASLRKRAGILIFVFLLAFQIPLAGYKQLNRIYNGNYALTNRGGYALYGNTARRMLPLDRGRFKTALAFIPGADVCAHFYGEACAPWGFLPVDVLASIKFQELNKTIQNPKEMDTAVLKESIKQIFINPLQYAFLTAVEATKIFFWESPQIYCVVYPESVSKIQDQPWLRFPLRITMAMASMTAFICGVFIIFRRRLISPGPQETPNDQASIILYSILLITFYTFFYSIFYITARYALPIAPLFIAMIAWRIDAFSKKRLDPKAKSV